MKVLTVTLLALASVTFAKNLDFDLHDVTAYGYFEKIGVPLADDIRKVEEEFLILNQTSSRIIGGSTASLGQFPFQAGLLSNLPDGRQGVCGGVLLRNNKVLTAAHCWFDGQTQAVSVVVVLGSTTLFYGGTRQTTSNVAMHTDWTPNIVRNDIAMITLSSAVTLSNNINVIALPTGSDLNDNFENVAAIASGYGRTVDGGNIGYFQALRHVSLNTISNAECLMFYNIIQDSNICTSNAQSTSVCQGDSGGPLTAFSSTSNTRILIGITSFVSGRGCAAAPAAFARVSSFIDFIHMLL